MGRNGWTELPIPCRSLHQHLEKHNGIVFNDEDCKIIASNNANQNCIAPEITVAVDSTKTQK